jgi:Zn ribbon nucleic-acid-binding protein
LTGDEVHDVKAAPELVEDIVGCVEIVDCGYDSNEFRKEMEANNNTAAALNKAAVRAFKPIPAPMRNTLTPDNGKEFADNKALSHALALDIYFAHPYH